MIDSATASRAASVVASSGTRRSSPSRTFCIGSLTPITPVERARVRSRFRMQGRGDCSAEFGLIRVAFWAGGGVRGTRRGHDRVCPTEPSGAAYLSGVEVGLGEANGRGRDRIPGEDRGRGSGVAEGGNEGQVSPARRLYPRGESTCPETGRHHGEFSDGRQGVDQRRQQVARRCRFCRGAVETWLHRTGLPPMGLAGSGHLRCLAAWSKSG